MWPEWSLVGSLIVTLAFVLRISVHAGQQPGGVDAWYYLAYADAFRRRPSFRVRLPQYLLQDEQQSGPPLFPMLLALVPQSWLRRWFWTVSPIIDCVHLVLLYWLAFKITRSLSVSAVTACIFACTPHLISETRSLSARSFGALVHSIALVLALRYVVFSASWPWLPLALLAGAAVFLASGSSATAYVFVSAVLSVVYADARYVLVCAGAVVLASVLSGGHFFRVVHNYLYAVKYWRRNRAMYGAHPIRHSPVYGRHDPARRPAAMPGFLGGGTLPQLIRLLGENPFILALPLTPRGVPPWGTRFYWWAIALTLLSVLATLVPPLRAFGPGRVYIKAAVFPSAYAIAVGIGTVGGFIRPIGVVTLACLTASLASVAFFWIYSRRQLTERTASVPPGLASAADHLARLPSDGFLCLPYMYADYAAYHSGKKVLWGGHCGNLEHLGTVAPVLRRSVPDLLREHGAQYLLVDRHFVEPRELGIDERFVTLGAWDSFVLYGLTRDAYTCPR